VHTESIVKVLQCPLPKPARDTNVPCTALIQKRALSVDRYCNYWLHFGGASMKT
jgi:hypothetical protein